MKVINIPIEDIEQKSNSRLHYDQDQMASLMGSIKQNGLLQPIGVAPIEPGADLYEVIYGNRRLLACEKLGWHEVPCVIQKTSEYEGENELINLVENMQRNQTSLKEIGRYIEMLEKKGFTHKEMAVRLGVTENFLKDAKREYNRVPEEFKGKIVANLGKGNKRAEAGKMSLSTVNHLEKSARALGLTRAQKKTLYQCGLVKGFQWDRCEHYATEVLRGAKVPQEIVDSVNESTKRILVTGYLDEGAYNALHDKFIANGPFSSMKDVILAGFNREISPKVKLRGRA